MRIVLLHGHGSRPSAFEALADRLRVAGSGVVVPQGPVDLMEGDDGPGSGPFAWWADDVVVPVVSVASSAYVASVASAASSVGDAWAALEQTLRTEEGRVVLVGFSQGGCLAVAGLWADPDLVAGAVCVGGFMPDGFEPKTRPGVAPGRLLVVHGEEDEVVDPFLAGLLVRTSRRAGLDVEDRRHDGGHVWPAEFDAADVLAFAKSCMET